MKLARVTLRGIVAAHALAGVIAVTAGCHLIFPYPSGPMVYDNTWDPRCVDKHCTCGHMSDPSRELFCGADPTIEGRDCTVYRDCFATREACFSSEGKCSCLYIEPPALKAILCPSGSGAEEVACKTVDDCGFSAPRCLPATEYDVVKAAEPHDPSKTPEPSKTDRAGKCSCANLTKKGYEESCGRDPTIEGLNCDSAADCAFKPVQPIPLDPRYSELPPSLVRADTTLTLCTPEATVLDPKAGHFTVRDCTPGTCKTRACWDASTDKFSKAAIVGSKDPKFSQIYCDANEVLYEIESPALNEVKGAWIVRTHRAYRSVRGPYLELNVSAPNKAKRPDLYVAFDARSVEFNKTAETWFIDHGFVKLPGRIETSRVDQDLLRSTAAGQPKPLVKFAVFAKYAVDGPNPLPASADIGEWPPDYVTTGAKGHDWREPYFVLVKPADNCKAGSSPKQSTFRGRQCVTNGLLSDSRNAVIAACREDLRSKYQGKGFCDTDKITIVDCPSNAMVASEPKLGVADLLFERSGEIDFGSPPWPYPDSSVSLGGTTHIISGDLDFELLAPDPSTGKRPIRINDIMGSTDGIAGYRRVDFYLAAPVDAQCAAPSTSPLCPSYKLPRGSVRLIVAGAAEEGGGALSLGDNSATDLSINIIDRLPFKDAPLQKLPLLARIMQYLKSWLTPGPYSLKLPKRAFNLSGDLVATLADSGGNKHAVRMAIDVWGRFRNFAPLADATESDTYSECSGDALETNSSPIVLRARDGLDADLDGDLTDTNFEWFEDFGLATQRKLGSGAKLTLAPGELSFGVHRVALVLTDTGGRFDTQGINVVVGDSQAPTMNPLPLPRMVTSPLFSLYPQPVHVDLGPPPSASDSCNRGVIEVANDAPAGSNFDPGLTVVTWSADDARGNIAEHEHNVWVFTLDLSPKQWRDGFSMGLEATLAPLRAQLLRCGDAEHCAAALAAINGIAAELSLRLEAAEGVPERAQLTDLMSAIRTSSASIVEALDRPVGSGGEPSSRRSTVLQGLNDVERMWRQLAEALGTAEGWAQPQQ